MFIYINFSLPENGATGFLITDFKGSVVTRIVCISFLHDKALNSQALTSLYLACQRCLNKNRIRPT